MTTLVAVAYSDQARAKQVLKELRTLETKNALDLQDASVITRDGQGKVHVEHDLNQTTQGAMAGTLLGLVVGGIVGLPLAIVAPPLAVTVGLGATLAGAGTGAVAGHLSDAGIDELLVREMSALLRPNSSALVLLVRQSVAEVVLPEIARFGGYVLQTTLAPEAEDRLRAALKDGPE